MRPETQRGQVLVIFAASLILLMLIAGLVFDLGTSWMLRRQEQNAADPGALAAAQYIPSLGGPGATTQMVEAACYYARQNGFFPSATQDDGCIPANDPGKATLTVNYPPVGAAAGAFEGRLGFVQVIIGRTHDNYFLPIIGQPTSLVSAAAVAADTTGDSNSYSLLALDPGNDCGSGQLGGNGGGSDTGKVTIQPVTDPATGLPYSGGYVQVNSTCHQTFTSPTLATCPSNGTGALQVSGGSSLTAPAIFVTGDCGDSGTITTSSGSNMVTQGALQVGDPLAELAPPDPSTYPAGQCGAGGPVSGPTGNASKGCGTGSMRWAGTSCTVNGLPSTCVSLQPGVYYGGWTVSNSITLDLAPGIYIMAGGGISVTGTGAITSVSNGAGSPAPVMIYSTDNPAASATCLAGTGSNYQCQGALDLKAQTTLDLAGMGSGAYKGILIWQDGNGSDPAAPVSLGGQTDLDISGTIYAPKAAVNLTGGGTVTNPGYAAIQIISWQWMISGGSTLTMPYDPNQLYHLEQRGLVH